MTPQNLLAVLDNTLKGLNLEFNKAIPVDIFPKLGYHAPNLEKLVLKGTPITDAVLMEISNSCPK